MVDFGRMRDVKSVRKARICEQCQKKIGVGSPAQYWAGVFEGDFYSQYLHPECQQVAAAYAKMADLQGDEWPWLCDFDLEDKAWVAKNFPDFAARMGWDKEVSS